MYFRSLAICLIVLFSSASYAEDVPLDTARFRELGLDTVSEDTLKKMTPQEVVALARYFCVKYMEKGKLVCDDCASIFGGDLGRLDCQGRQGGSQSTAPSGRCRDKGIREDCEVFRD